MMAKYNYTPMTVLSLLLLAVGVAAPQHAGLNVTLESVRPTPIGSQVGESLRPIETPLESILPDPTHDWTQGKANKDLYKFNVEWGAVDGLTVKRNVSQTRVSAAKRPFDTAVRGQEEQSIILTPFAGTTFEMSKMRTETVDLASISLGGSEVEAMKMQQQFGGGATGGAVSFSQTTTRSMAPTGQDPFAPLKLTDTTVSQVLGLTQGFNMLGETGKLQYTRSLTTTQKPGEFAQEQQTQTLALNTALWAKTNVAGTYEQSHSSLETGLHSQKRELQFSRKFASGDAIVAFSSLDKRQNRTLTETHTQKVQLPFRIDGTIMAVAFDSNTVQTGGKLMAEQRSGSLATKIAGNDLKMSWDRNLALKGGAENKTTKMAFSLPVDFFGEKANFSFTSDGTQTNTAVAKKSRVATVALPLSHFVQGASFNYNVTGTQQAGKVPTEVRVAKLIMPLSILDTDVATNFERTTTHTPSGKTTQFVAQASAPISVLNRKITTVNQYVAVNLPNGAQQDRLNTTVTVPTKPGNVTVTRNVTTDTAVDGTGQETRVVTLASPRVPLNKMASVQYNMQMTDPASGTDQRVDHVNVQTQPAKTMTVGFDWTATDLGVDKETEQRQVNWTWQLSPRLEGHWVYLEKEQLDRSPYIQRSAVVQNKSDDPSDLRVRAAVASTDTGAVEGDWLKAVEVGYGDPKRLGVSVKMQEYDEKKMTSLGDPVLQFGLQSGNPNSLQWQVSYEDFSGRPQPHRHYGVAFPLGDTAFQFAFSQNTIDPMDPKKKAIRVADTYDATISRNIFNDVAMDVAYRYLEYPDGVTSDEQTEQWLQMKLAGGKPDKGGTIQVAYASGDFVELVTKQPANTPTSTLSVQYEKTWSEDGKLTLQLDRNNMPNSIPSLKDTYEGRVQFDYRF